eukprot:3041126-Amphidinium_carterae.1
MKSTSDNTWEELEVLELLEQTQVAGDGDSASSEGATAKSSTGSRLERRKELLSARQAMNRVRQAGSEGREISEDDVALVLEHKKYSTWRLSRRTQRLWLRLRTVLT